MENQASPENIVPNMEFTPLAVSHMGQIRKWTYFFSILGFVFIGLFVLVALMIGSVFSSFAGDTMPFPGYMISAIYLVLALLYFFPVLYLYRFSVQIKKGLNERSSHDVAGALGHLRSHYTFIGYMCIIMLSIYALVLVGVGLAALLV
jgi:hypothetical protein